jgi:hypothetical protein
VPVPTTVYSTHIRTASTALHQFIKYATLSRWEHLGLLATTPPTTPYHSSPGEIREHQKHLKMSTCSYYF